MRLALGADRSAVLQWAFAIGMRPVLAGGAIGLLLALLSAYALRAALFGVSTLDPMSFTLVVLILLVTGAAACYLPARRAAAVDLRCD